MGVSQNHPSYLVLKPMATGGIPHDLGNLLICRELGSHVQQGACRQERPASLWRGLSCGFWLTKPGIFLGTCNEYIYIYRYIIHQTQIAKPRSSVIWCNNYTIQWNTGPKHGVSWAMPSNGHLFWSIFWVWTIFRFFNTDILRTLHGCK